MTVKHIIDSRQFKASTHLHIRPNKKNMCLGQWVSPKDPSQRCQIKSPNIFQMTFFVKQADLFDKKASFGKYWGLLIRVLLRGPCCPKWGSFRVVKAPTHTPGYWDTYREMKVSSCFTLITECYVQMVHEVKTIRATT